MKIVCFNDEVMVLEDGTELPVAIPFDASSITLKELNELYAKSAQFIESIQAIGSDREDS